MSGRPPSSRRAPARPLAASSYGALAAPSGADSQHLLMEPAAWERRVRVPFCVNLVLSPFLLLGLGLVGGYIFLAVTHQANLPQTALPVFGVVAVIAIVSAMLYQKRIHIDPTGMVLSYGAPCCFCYRESIPVSSMAEIEVRSREVGDENGIVIRYQVVAVTRAGRVIDLAPYDEIERAEGQAGDLRQLLGLESATAV